ncbi:MAG: hypothetical protein BM565_03475 [Gammaproteobacteria bacterium MedPE]|nr:MAG: hypothetical protein BM565_03475 [Gammaproteobacteria bacterium MedPE]
MTQENDPIALMQQGNYEAARAGFKAQLEKNPTAVNALHFYGMLSIILNDIADGISYMSLSLSLSPDNSAFISNAIQALELLAHNKHGNANKILSQQLTKATKNHVPSALSVAKFYLKKKQAKDCLDVLAPHTSPSFETLFYKAIAHQLLSQKEVARRAMERALTCKPYHPLYSSKEANDKPRVLLIYALENLDFVPQIGDEIAFSIYGGHFDANKFIDINQVNISRLFVSDSDNFRESVKQLGHYDLIINCIADMEVCANALTLLTQFERFTHETINPPTAVLNTSRVDIYQQLSSLSLQIADTNIFHSNAQFAHYNSGFPALARPLGSSTGIGLVKLEDKESLDQYLSQSNGEILNICPFIDFKSSDGLYRKYRVFVIDGEIYPEHCVAHNHWNVHSSSRMTLMKDNEQLRQQERLFVDDISTVLSPAHQATIKQIYKKLSLDYFGIDFSFTTDGELLIFEANAGMRVNTDYLKDFEYLTTPITKIIDAFKQMINYRITT